MEKLLRFANDQPVAFVVAEIAPQPADKDKYFIAEANQVHQMYKHPNVPGKESLKTHPAQIDYCLVSSYSCHASLVEIAKR